MNKSYIYLLADEIDHITIKYRDYGEKLKTKEAVDKLLYCIWTFDEIKNEFSNTDIKKENLLSLSDNELYDLLVKTRNILLSNILKKI